MGNKRPTCLFVMVRENLTTAEGYGLADDARMSLLPVIAIWGNLANYGWGYSDVIGNSQPRRTQPERQNIHQVCFSPPIEFCP
jgi:hypothetical protein